MPSPKKKLGIIILAAGSSRRMNGKPKQMLVYQGETLLRRAAKSAIQAEFEKVVVVIDARRDSFINELKDLPIEIVFNENSRTGISSSIKSGLAKTGEADLDAILIMLCDQPLITAEILRRFAEIHFQTGKAIVAGKYENTFGVPALFASELFADLESLADDEGAKKIIAENPDKTELLAVPEAGLDIDTAEDYEKLIK